MARLLIEPPHGSVVMTESETGTAWQRHHSDGLWHSTAKTVLPWPDLIKRGYVRVIYRTPEED